MDSADLKPQDRGVRAPPGEGQLEPRSETHSGSARPPGLPVGLEGPRSEARKDSDTVGSRGPVLSFASVCPESV